VVVAFIILYIPDFLRAKDPSGGALPSDQIAQVNGRGVSVLEFRTAYQRQVSAYRQAYGANVSEQAAAAARLRAAGAAAADQRAGHGGRGRPARHDRHRRRGAAPILAMPEFQLNGQFIGEAQYQAMLNSARPPMTPSEFEAASAGSSRREAPRRRHRLARRDRRRGRRRVRAPERKVKVQLVHFASSAFLAR